MLLSFWRGGHHWWCDNGWIQHCLWLNLGDRIRFWFLTFCICQKKHEFPCSVWKEAFICYWYFLCKYLFIMFIVKYVELGKIWMRSNLYWIFLKPKFSLTDSPKNNNWSDDSDKRCVYAFPENFLLIIGHSAF